MRASPNSNSGSSARPSPIPHGQPILGRFLPGLDCRAFGLGGSFQGSRSVACGSYFAAWMQLKKRCAPLRNQTASWIIRLSDWIAPWIMRGN